MYCIFRCFLISIPYPLEYNHGVVFFNMSFWVRFNSKNPSKRGLFDQKMGFYSRKSPKTGLLKRGEVIFKSGAVLERIRYDIVFFRLTPPPAMLVHTGANSLKKHHHIVISSFC